MTKINNITITGVRGVRDTLHMEPAGKSMLVYGDNGAGKSTVADVVEWFFHDRIDHLSNEEIGRGGLEALRNVFLPQEQAGTADIRFSNSECNSCKSIYYKKSTLKSQHSNGEATFNDYIKNSRKENLVLRSKELADFVLASKKDKMVELSDIIGFSKVSAVREILRRSAGELKREFAKKDYDNRISRKQANIVHHLGQNTPSHRYFLEAVNRLIDSLGISKISNFGEIDGLLDSFTQTEDSGLVEIQSFYTRLSDWLAQLPALLGETQKTYREFIQKHRQMTGNIEHLNKILLESLLTEGTRLLDGGSLDEDSCPLCLQRKNRLELRKELRERLQQMHAVKKEKQQLEQLKRTLKTELEEPLRRSRWFSTQGCIGQEDNRLLMEKLESLQHRLNRYLEGLNVELLPMPGERAGQMEFPGEDETIFSHQHLQEAAEHCRLKLTELQALKKDDPSYDIHSKITLAREAFLEIEVMKKEQVLLEQQHLSMEKIYARFLNKQKDGLKSFLDRFSGEINDIYRYMNPGENVTDIRLKPMEKDSELVGLTMEMDFLQQSQAPPQKYLSESHLNCLGIAFFLTSVKAFNKENKFFVLDDVVSGFDHAHRLRFASMLREKFAEYQVIILTHEKEWFDMVSKKYLEEDGKGNAGDGNPGKSEPWQVVALDWSTEKGTYLTDLYPPADPDIREAEQVADPRAGIVETPSPVPIDAVETVEATAKQDGGGNDLPPEAPADERQTRTGLPITENKWENDRQELCITGLKKSITDDLAADRPGNLEDSIKQYLLLVLGPVLYRFQVKVPFLFNDSNERRDPYELLSLLRNHIKRQKNVPMEAKNTGTIDPLLKSRFLDKEVAVQGILFKPGKDELQQFQGEVEAFEQFYRQD
ncbi:MAG: hypothetical protein GY765_33015 [bacterium]|nr:hypothetical protein [bacterium]